MRIFVTGANGHIGSAVVTNLLEAGHQVLGLARSDASAEVVEDLGAEALQGNVNDLELVHDAARRTDGTLHLAFDNAAAAAGDLAGASAADLLVVKAFAEALDGTDKPFVAHGIGPTGDARTDAIVGQNPRAAIPRAIAEFPKRGIRSALVAIPPVVHSARDRIGFIPTLVTLARSTGVSGYVADGANCWPAVHTLDLSRLFSLAIENSSAGAQLYGAGQDDVTTRKIAETIARHLDVPAQSISPEESEAHFGGFATIMALDFPPMTSPETQQRFAWQPTHPGLIEDLEDGFYFAAA